jgi:hypothetical protein
MEAEAQTVWMEWSVEMMRRTLVAWFSRLTTYARGKEILIVGPGSAGKTKFAQYLRHRRSGSEGQRDMTYAHHQVAGFVWESGTNRAWLQGAKGCGYTPARWVPVIMPSWWAAGNHTLWSSC